MAGTVKTSLVMLALVVVHSACGLDDARPIEERTVTPRDQAPVDTPTAPRATEGVVASGPEVGQCTTVQTWFSAHEPWSMLSPSFVGFSANDAIAIVNDDLGGLGLAVAVRDGARLQSPSRLRHVDHAWARVIEHDAESYALVVRDRVSRETLLSLEDAEHAGSTMAALDDDGARAAAVSCRDGVLSLRVFDVDSGDAPPLLEETLMTNDEPYCWWWSSVVPTVRFVPGTGAVVVGLVSTGEIVHVDVDTRVSHRVVAHERLPEEDGVAWYEDGPLLALDVAPDGSHVVSTGSDGRLRRFKLPALVAVDDGREVATRLVNTMVYAPPRLVSPVAFSPSGAVVFEVGSDGVPVVRDAATGATLLVVERPDLGPLESEDEHALAWREEVTSAIAAGFSRSGRALMVVYPSGVALWRCSDDSDPPLAPLSVSLVGALSLASGETGHLNVVHDGGDGFFTTTVISSTSVWAYPSAHAGLDVYGWESGTHELRVRVDDGVRHGEASTLVVIE